MRKGVAEQAGQRDDLEPPVGGLGFFLFVQIVHVYEYLYCSRYSSTPVYSLANWFSTSFAFIQPILALFPHSFFRITNSRLRVRSRLLARSLVTSSSGRSVNFLRELTLAFLHSCLSFPFVEQKPDRTKILFARSQSPQFTGNAQTCMPPLLSPSCSRPVGKTQPCQRSLVDRTCGEEKA